MKVAICFSGALRSFDECISSTMKYLISNFDDPDIYLHLWTFNDENITDINYNFKWRKDSSSINDVLSILKPKKFIIEEYNNSSEELIKKSSMVNMDLFDTDDKKNYGFNCCSMYWKILKSFELAEEYMKENNFEYDLIIRARLDFIWEDYIRQINFINPIDDTIYLIRDRYATCSKLVTNDKFFAGNYNTMKKMCNIFYCLKKYQDLGIMIEGQTINETHIKDCNFIVKWIGHSNTYYKFMGRHKISNNKIKLLVNLKNHFTTNTNNELIYTLINNGYNVSSNNEIYKYNLCNKNYLQPCKQNLINEYDYIIYDNNEKIIIQYKTNDTNNTNNSIELDFMNWELIDLVNLNTNYLTDFILSIIKNFSNIKKYMNFKFQDVKQINTINSNEKIIYKYSDRGYYLCEYFNKNDNDTHVIIFNKNKTKVFRDTFKIIDLFKYYQEGILPIN